MVCLPQQCIFQMLEYTLLDLVWNHKLDHFRQNAGISKTNFKLFQVTSIQAKINISNHRIAPFTKAISYVVTALIIQHYGSLQAQASNTSQRNESF